MAFIKYGDSSIVNIIEDEAVCDKCGRKMAKDGDRYICECGYEKESSIDEQRTSN